jgi:hypothetical protein
VPNRRSRSRSTALPYALNDDRAVDPAHKFLYAYLLLHCDGEGKHTSWPGMEAMAAAMGVTRKTVDLWTNALFAHKLLASQWRRGRGKTNVYDLALVADQAQGNWARLPNWLFAAADLPAAVRLFHCYLSRRRNRGKGYALVSQERMAADMGVSLVTIKRWLAQLEHTGLLSVERRGTCMVNHCRPLARTLRPLPQCHPRGH